MEKIVCPQAQHGQTVVIMVSEANVGGALLFSAGLSVPFCGHSNLVIYHLISSKYHICETHLKLSPKFGYGFCPTNDNQDCLLQCTDNKTMSQ